MVLPNFFSFIIKLYSFTILFFEQLYNFLFFEFDLFLPVFNQHVRVNILSLFTLFLAYLLVARLIDKLPIA